MKRAQGAVDMELSPQHEARSGSGGHGACNRFPPGSRLARGGTWRSVAREAGHRDGVAT